MRTFEEVFVDEGMRLFFLPVEDQLAHLLQVFLCLRTVVVMWRAAPEGLLVELNLFRIGFTIDHGTQMGVSNRQRFQPVGCCTVIPQFLLYCLSRHRYQQHQYDCCFFHFISS